MDVKNMSIEQLKVLFYDQLKVKEISEANIRMIVAELDKKENSVPVEAESELVEEVKE